MNKIIANIFVALFIIGLMVFIVYTSWINYDAINLAKINIPFVSDEPFQTTTAAVILLSFVLGGLVGAVYVIKVNADCNDDIKFYKNKLARISQNNDSDSALIDSLQRKISSLEIALQNALKNQK